LARSRYVGFDFHEVCKGDNFEAVSKLIEKVDSDLKALGYFVQDSEGRGLVWQKGTPRVNCLDCLDRTNLVMSELARRVLAWQMEAFGVGGAWNSSSSIVERLFKEAWANNGDAVSQQYAGTSALKGDFTRTGRRRMRGKLNDGVNSMTRYVINTFCDGLRQAAIDLVLGVRDERELEVYASRERTVEERLDAVQSLWTEDQASAIRTCTAALPPSSDPVLSGWILISINKRGLRQERVVLLSRSALYRCKYKYKDCRLLHFKRIVLSSLLGAYVGPYRYSGRPYGLCILSSDNKKPHHYFQALLPTGAQFELGREIIHDIVEMIGELWTELDEEAAEPFFIEEKELSYPSSGGVAKAPVRKAYNTFRLGINRSSLHRIEPVVPSPSVPRPSRP